MIDFWAQVALILATVMGGPIPAIYLGAWQVSSAIITTIGSPRLRNWRLVYLLSVSLYFLGMTNRALGDVLIVGIPIVLAIAYLSLTAEQILTSNKSGKGFLPHTSF